MGIPELWQIIKGQDHSVLIAQLAEDHFTKHGRPLRIAVDEADWRFNNLTSPQVFAIRAKSNQPAFQGIEKAMFYRICRLLALNMQLLFVFDGPRRPAKRGRNGGTKIDYEQRRLLKELLQHFRIPYHEAPGEAEAECARLQILGVVDAVWSQDSDTLMFGCDLLIRDDRIARNKDNADRSKENTKKSATSVRVVRGQEIRGSHKLDRDALVLFAMLAGGDYDTSGLRGCGSSTALRIAQIGLGRSLCQCRTREDCLIWRESLLEALQRAPRNGMIQVPSTYPDIKILNKYNRPTISTDEQLWNLRGLRKGWNQPIDELKLLEVTSSRFNIWGRLYMNWVGPVLLTKYLVSRDPSLPPENNHQIKMVQPRGKQREHQALHPPLERKVTFSPFGLTTLQQRDFEGPRAGYWTSAADEPFEPDHRVQWEFPHYMLAKVLPPVSSRKRNDRIDPMSNADTLSPAKKRQRTSGTRATANGRTSLPTPCQAAAGPLSYVLGAQIDPRRHYDLAPSDRNCVCLISDDEDSDLEDPSSLHSFRGHAPLGNTGNNPQPPNVLVANPSRPSTSNIIDLGPGDEDSFSDDDDELRQAISLSLNTPTKTPAMKKAASPTRSDVDITSPGRSLLRSKQKHRAQIPDRSGRVSGPKNRAPPLSDDTTFASPARQANLSSSVIEVEDTRARRRRHFERSTNVSNHESIAPTAKLTMTKLNGIDCIDLT